MERKEFCIGEYIISRIGSMTPAFAFAYPVLDKNKRLRAVLTTAIKLANFSDFHDISNLPDKSFVAVTDHKGIRLFYYPPKEDTNPVGKKITTQSWEKASKDKGSEIFIGRGSDRVRRIFAFEQVRFKPNDTPYLYVWAGIPEAYVLDPANADLTRNLLLMILATALSLFISWSIGKKAIIFPIQSLVNLTQKFAQGDLEARSELAIMPNELGTLTKAFHNMADALVINQRTLRNSEEKYRRLIQNALVGIYQVTKEGRFLTVNQKMVEIFEYESQDNFLAEVDNISNLYAHSEERVLILQEIDEKGFVGGKEVEFITKYGKSIWIELYTTVFVDDKNTIYEGLMHDITDQKKLETELKQVHKMESIGTLAGGIAHDFNNILGIILGNTELAIDDVPKWNPARLNLEEVITASLRAKDVVRQLLSFARKTELEKKPINITPIVKETLKLLRSSIPTSIEIRQNIPNNIGTILADPTQIDQVLINLCTNAAHAMPNGGVIDIKLENVKLDEAAASNSPDLSPGHFLNLTVSDTGYGIDPKDIDRIFDPYFTTKEVGSGTGMGLAVIHGIIKGHGASISVQSQPGIGTTFSIFFPVVEADAVVETETAEEFPRGSERILFIDDEESIVKMGQQILKRLGYEPEIRTNPVEALELFRSNPELFDLVITDMTMPQMSGDTLAKKILGIHPNMPVILCTGFSEKVDEKSAREMGIAAFILKPIVMRDIAHTIREVLDKKK